jgi:hypothetical protein
MMGTGNRIKWRGKASCITSRGIWPMMGGGVMTSLVGLEGSIINRLYPLPDPSISIISMTSNNTGRSTKVDYIHNHRLIPQRRQTRQGQNLSVQQIMVLRCVYRRQRLGPRDVPHLPRLGHSWHMAPQPTTATYKLKHILQFK